MKNRSALIGLIVFLAFFSLAALQGNVTAYAATHQANASFIRNVSCSNKDFVRITSNDASDRCYRDNGYTGINPHLTHVVNIYSGNNTGFVRAYIHGTVFGENLTFLACMPNGDPSLRLYGDWDLTQIQIISQDNTCL